MAIVKAHHTLTRRKMGYPAGVMALGSSSAARVRITLSTERLSGAALAKLNNTMHAKDPTWTKPATLKAFISTPLRRSH